MSRPVSGPAYALAAAFLFGASTPAARALITAPGGFQPWLLAGVLYLGSGLGLALTRLYGRLRGQRFQESPLRRGDLPWLTGAVLLGGVMGPVLLMEGLRRMAAAPASLLLNLEGAFTAALAWFAFREPFDRRIFTGMVLILLGGVVLSWRGGALSIGAGALPIAGACLCWALDNNLTRKISGSDAGQIAMVKGLAAGTTNLTLALLVGFTLPSWPRLGLGAGVGFFGYGLSLVCFVRALRLIGTARTGAYFSTAPFVGAGLALAIGSEPLSLRLLVSGALMGIGVWLHLSEVHDHGHTHEAMAHAHLHWHDAHHQHAHSPEDPPKEPHSHPHRHEPITHRHPHSPDIHHLHPHP